MASSLTLTLIVFATISIVLLGIAIILSFRVI